jgi:catechol 2,3-dioxygenase-like lactoylglutathione lyase family enzyme
MSTPRDAREFASSAPEMFVPDVEAAVRFYTEKLGFELLRLEPGFAVVALGTALILLAHESAYGPMGGGAMAQRGAGIDIRIMVPDVNSVYRRCGENGVTVVHDIADRPYRLRDFIIADLNGFRLRFASLLV